MPIGGTPCPEQHFGLKVWYKNQSKWLETMLLETLQYRQCPLRRGEKVSLEGLYVVPVWHS